MIYLYYKMENRRASIYQLKKNLKYQLFLSLTNKHVSSLSMNLKSRKIFHLFQELKNHSLTEEELLFDTDHLENGKFY